MNFGSTHVALAHGGGGQLTDELLARHILPKLKNEALDELLDSGLIEHAGQKLALTIDSYVVQPLVFPGGDIGRLAISGTVNDLAVCGAEAKCIALGLILAEGLEIELLEKVMRSISDTAAEANVRVVTGDTKVVGRGQADGMYITTAGVGVSASGKLHPRHARPGDVLVINGPIADHGMAVMLAREMPEVKSILRSDVAPLNGMIRVLLERVPSARFLRDPTRGGLACLAADLAARCGARVVLDEERIPVHPATLHAAELLGLDVLEVANEGKVVAVVPPEEADAAVAAMRSDDRGREATVIGRIEKSEADDRGGLCLLRTRAGGLRIVTKPYGEQLPRIC